MKERPSLGLEARSCPRRRPCSKSSARAIEEPPNLTINQKLNNPWIVLGDERIVIYVTCHHAGPGMVSWKKFRALQTIERVFPGAIGTLKEQIHITHFWSPTIGSFVSISILNVAKQRGGIKSRPYQHEAAGEQSQSKREICNSVTFVKDD